MNKKEKKAIDEQIDQFKRFLDIMTYEQKKGFLAMMDIISVAEVAVKVKEGE